MSKVAHIFIDTKSISDSYTIDCSKGDRLVIRLVVGANLSILVSNYDVGTEITLIIKQDATGGRVITLGSVYKWVGGSAPSLTTVANAVDILRFTSSTDLLWEISRSLDVK